MPRERAAVDRRSSLPIRELWPTMESQQPRPDTQGTAPRAVAMGSRTGAGAASMVAAQMGAKGATMVAQIVLGWLLSEDDFGVWASAMALTAITGALRDGGVREYIVQQGQSAWAALHGPLFWLALAMNCGVAVFIVAISPAAAWAYDDARMIPILLITAASIPISTVSAVLQAKLRVDLDFSGLAQMNLVSGVLRQIATVAFALMGLGPVSFVLPVILCFVYEGIFCMMRTGERPWKSAAQVRTWLGLLATTKWLIFGSLANLLLDHGMFAAIGLVVAKSVVGGVYFGFMMVIQLAVLLSFAIQQVLAPVMARMREEPERLRHAALRSARSTVLVASGACITLAAVMSPLESIIWHGRWEAAVMAVQIFAMFFAMRCTFGLSTAIFHAQGRFMRWSVLTLWEAILLIAFAVAGAFLGGFEGGPWIDGPFGGRAGPTDIALWAGAALGIGRFLVTADALRSCGAARGERIGALMQAWVLGAAAMLVTALADLAIFWGHGWQAPGAAPSWSGGFGLAQRLVNIFNGTSMFGRGVWPYIAMDVVRLIVLGSICTIAYTVLARVFIRSHLEEMLMVTPARLRGPVRRVLLLRERVPEAAAVGSSA